MGETILFYNIYNIDLLTKLKASTIKAFYESISANEALSRTGLNNVKTILNQVFDHAIDRDYVSSNVARSVRTNDLICREEDNDDLIYSDEERRKVIFQAIREDDVFARAIFLMFSLCVRIGELKSLKWSDIDWDNKTVFIHSQIVRQKDAYGHEYFEYLNRTKGKKKEANRVQPQAGFHHQCQYLISATQTGADPHSTYSIPFSFNSSNSAS